jgi:hypothetical protein
MRSAVFLVLLFVSGLAYGTESIETRCAAEAKATGLVYEDIFSVVIELKDISNASFDQTMQRLGDQTLHIIEWDVRGDNQIRAFVTWPKGAATSAAKETLLFLGKQDGVRTLCVSKSLRL